MVQTGVKNPVFGGLVCLGTKKYFQKGLLGEVAFDTRPKSLSNTVNTTTFFQNLFNKKAPASKHSEPQN